MTLLLVLVIMRIYRRTILCVMYVMLFIIVQFYIIIVINSVAMLPGDISKYSVMIMSQMSLTASVIIYVIFICTRYSSGTLTLNLSTN